MPRHLERKKFHYILFYKPYGVLCQFTDQEDRPTLASFGPFPRSVYPAGRLDRDSEGLLLLTDDGRLKHFLLDPSFGHERSYLAQVEHVPSLPALTQLRHGILLGGKPTRPAVVQLVSGEPPLPPRSEAIRFRRNVPTTWIRLTLTEGRNRQVRRMTAAVGHPTLRLVRVGIGPLTLSGLFPGQHRELSAEERRKLLGSVGLDITKH